MLKTVIIAGGSSGIGLACVEKFLLESYTVYNIDIQESSIEHSKYNYIKTDVTNKAEVKKSVAQVIKTSGRVDSLVVSIGKHLSANIENTSIENIEELINLNIVSVLFLIAEVIPHMKLNNKGSIVTLGSDQSTIVKPNSTLYALTKAAVSSLTKSVALDYAKYNIRANCVAAGTTDTPLYRNAIELYSKKLNINLKTIEKEEAELQPLLRIGKASEIANLAYFLASDDASFITGGLIPIDGGYTTK